MKNKRNKITLIIAALVAVGVLACGLIGLKDAQAMDSSVTFASNFVDNLKSDTGILVAAVLIGTASASIVLPRVVK